LSFSALRMKPSSGVVSITTGLAPACTIKMWRHRMSFFKVRRVQHLHAELKHEQEP
jgi:hypothetical protein